MSGEPMTAERVRAIRERTEVANATVGPWRGIVSIVSAREDVPDLCDEVERLLAALAAVTAERDDAVARLEALDVRP